MDVIIIEDEKPATDKLERMLNEINADIRIIAKLQNVKDAIIFFQNLNIKPALILADIQLQDGTCFDIFESCNLNIPVIFITAYDQYALKAFEYYGMDYLLKPLIFESLQKSINKFNKLQSSNTALDFNNYKELADEIAKPATDMRSRFLIKLGDHLKYVQALDIALFYADGREVYLINFSDARYIIDYSLDTLETLLNKQQFLRVNRTFILNIKSIADVVIYSGSRLKVNTTTKIDHEIIVSRSKVGEFKNWFDGLYQ